MSAADTDEYLGLTAAEAARLHALLTPLAGRSIPTRGGARHEPVAAVLAALRVYTSMWGTAVDTVTPLEAVDQADPTSEDPFATIEDRAELEAMMSRLSPFERRCLDLRYGLTTRDPMTVAEVADTVAAPRRYVSRVIAVALNKCHPRDLESQEATQGSEIRYLFA